MAASAAMVHTKVASSGTSETTSPIVMKRMPPSDRRTGAGCAPCGAGRRRIAIHSSAPITTHTATEISVTAQVSGTTMSARRPAPSR